MRKCSAVEDFARRGACPPLGSGRGVAESAAPTRCTESQLRIFIPWCAGDAGMSDWYENDVTRSRECPHSTAPALVVPVPQLSFRRRPASTGRGLGNVVRSKTSRGEGLVPRWGRGGEWQNPPYQFSVPSHSSGFSYLGVPAPAGVSDDYENRLVRPTRSGFPPRP